MKHTSVAPIVYEDILSPNSAATPQQLFDWCCVMVLEGQCPKCTLTSLYVNRYPSALNASVMTKRWVVTLIEGFAEIVHTVPDTKIVEALRMLGKELRLDFNTEYEAKAYTQLLQLKESAHDQD